MPRLRFRLAPGSRLLAALMLGLAGVTAPAQASHWALLVESPQVGGISAFAARADGTFFACKVDGNDPQADWTATSHGKPGLGAVGQPSAHFHSTSTGLYVFTRTESGNLYLRSAPQAFNNNNPAWTWTNLSKPANATIASDPASASYGNKEYAFVVGSDQHLHGVSGPAWTWSDHQTPGVGLVGRPSTIVYADSLYVFVVGSDGQLYLRTWNGIAWSWVSAGMPPSGTQLVGSPAAVKDGNTIDVFVGGADQHLYRRTWTGAAWQWSDQGAVPQGIGTPDAAWFGGNNGQLDLYAFALRYVGGQPNLLENHWNATDGWELPSHGAPPQTLLFQQPAIAAAFSGPIETWPTWRINVFVPARENRIYRRVFAPGARGVWQWVWSSKYCQM